MNTEEIIGQLLEEVVQEKESEQIEHEKVVKNII